MPQYFLKNPGGSSNFAQNSHPQFEIQSNTNLYFHLLWSWTLSLNEDEKEEKKDTLEFFSVLLQKSFKE